MNYNMDMKRIGTDYGGWKFKDCDSLYGSTIIAGGCGEDISFDIGFASHYNAKVIMVDPTPRAVSHVRSVFALLGNSAKTTYVEGGKQPTTSYDLTTLTQANFEFIEKALWDCQDVVNFYPPPNIEHVSHSIGNWQGGFSKTGDHIKVETTTVKDIVDQYGINELELIKFDIEGAEIEVIEQMLKDNIFPKQILVEYDELQVENDYSKQRHSRVNSSLLNSGYVIVNIDNINNYSYVGKI